MRNPTSLHLREIVFAVCAAWLVLQNIILFVLLALFPHSELGTAALVLVRVAIRAATPLALGSGVDVLAIAGTLLAAGLGVLHG